MEEEKKNRMAEPLSGFESLPVGVLERILSRADILSPQDICAVEAASPRYLAPFIRMNCRIWKAQLPKVRPGFVPLERAGMGYFKREVAKPGNCQIHVRKTLNWMPFAYHSFERPTWDMFVEFERWVKEGIYPREMILEKLEAYQTRDLLRNYYRTLSERRLRETVAW